MVDKDGKGKVIIMVFAKYRLEKEVTFNSRRNF